jgi:hypothetical protein
MSEITIEHNPDGIEGRQKVAEDAAQSGRNVDVQKNVEQSNDVIFIDRDEIRPRNNGIGQTEIILQRHGKYERDKDSPNVGSLTPEAVRLETESAIRYFSELIQSVPEEERGTLNILFVSSDTSYAGGGQRSYETTSIAQRVAEQLFESNGIPAENILNITPDLNNNPMALPELREPQMFEQSPDFVEFMRKKYGDLGKEFWIAFEEDTEEETRRSMDAEGPDEIADRIKYALTILANWSQSFHQQELGNRLVIWAGTHYDTISPFVKRDVLHKDKSKPVLVDYGGGVVIDIDQAGNTTTSIAGDDFEVNL